MPQPGTALEKLGFLTVGLFDGEDPGPGHQVTLEMIEPGERLGFGMAARLGPVLGWTPKA